jgi:hypothetical protein
MLAVNLSLSLQIAPVRIQYILGPHDCMCQPRYAQMEPNAKAAGQ